MEGKSPVVSQKRGLGVNGKTLVEMAEENRRLLLETGHYHGVKELKLKQEDPAKYEIFHSRLLSTVINVREAIRRISASPMVREESEQCYSLYTPEGDSVVYSTGIQIHVECMAHAVRYLVEHNWENMLGIKEGDVFETNDCAVIGGVHGADVYDISPILWNGELVGWVSSTVHEGDIGGINPGGMSFMATDRFTDGHHVCGEKIAENDQIRADYPLRIRGSVRLPEYWLLDTKARIAGNIMVREEVKGIIREFGVEYYRQVTRELIEEERRAQLERVKNQLVPGRYRGADVADFLFSRLPMLPYAKKDSLCNRAIELMVDPEGRMIISADGVTSWGYHGLNAPKSAMDGGLNLALSQVLTYDGKVNHGSFLATELKLPLGSIFNPGNPNVGTGLSFCSFLGFYGVLLNLVSRARFSRGFREEILLSGAGSTEVIFGGTNQYGQEYGFINIEVTAAGGMGARGVTDGLSVSYAVWQMDANLGNVEFLEMMFPVLWIGRKVLPDSSGFGKYRAGLNLQSTFLVQNSDKVILQIPPLPSHITTFGNTGVYGGYPGSPDYSYHLVNTNFKELVEQKKPLVHEEGDPRDPDIKKLMKGDLSQVHEYYFSDFSKSGDIFQKLYFESNGGYGDPIERDPMLVKQDLDNGHTFPFTARSVCGVEASYDEKAEEWKIDFDKTSKLRAEIRERRKKRGIPAKDWWKQTRKRITEKRLDPLIMEMFKDAFKLSPGYAEEYKKFWALPNDFSF